MATREEVSIALQALQVLTNCQRDLRANAQSYLAEIAAGHPRLTTAQLGAIAHADGAAIARLMTMMTSYFSDQTRVTKVTNGLTQLGLTYAQAVADHNQILSVANAQASADVSTDAAITSGANWVLANTLALDLLY